jgi:hypothetical protein
MRSSSLCVVVPYLRARVRVRPGDLGLGHEPWPFGHVAEENAGSRGEVVVEPDADAARLAQLVLEAADLIQEDERGVADLLDDLRGCGLAGGQAQLCQPGRASAPPGALFMSAHAVTLSGGHDIRAHPAAGCGLRRVAATRSGG